MLTAFILICALNTNCTLDNAIDVLRVPGTFNMPVACLQQAIEYSAQVDYPLKSNQKFSFVCKHDGSEAHAG
ncbi:MAG TPA: hypothetical protein VEP90_21445 [Methylomirabilota bacterium]|nr:hypothetical protein [Methylomirabilota bacterium]